MTLGGMLTFASVILFILKVCGLIAVSWWVVAAPFLASVIGSITLLVIAALVAVIASR